MFHNVSFAPILLTPQSRKRNLTLMQERVMDEPRAQVSCIGSLPEKLLGSHVKKLKIKEEKIYLVLIVCTVQEKPGEESRELSPHVRTAACRGN